MFFNKSKKLLEEKEIELESALKKNASYEAEFKEIIDKNELLAEKKSLLIKIEENLKDLNEKYKNALTLYEILEREIELYKDTLEINSFGLHKPQFSYDTSEKFKNELELNYENQKYLIKNDRSVVCNTEWTVGGSKIEGRKMTNQYKKLMLFAFNGECDALISKVKWNNATKTEQRIVKSFNTINKLGESQNIFITEDYLNLKLKELALTYEYEQKKYEEKEEQRLIREQMREEEKAQKEFEKAQKEAEEEERRFQKALEKAKQELQVSNGLNTSILIDQIKELESKLKDAHDRKERAIAQAQLTKVGHIYVISNVGSFGESVYKIGMTRRLDPLDRVRELGDASVPFQFDIHAIIYSENAPQFESELHKKFADRRLNRVNQKKEFFKVTLEEIEDFVKLQVNASIEFTKVAEAREFRETMALLGKINNILSENMSADLFPKSLI